MERHQPLHGVASRAERRRPGAAVLPVKVRPSADTRTLGTRYDRRSGCTGRLLGLTGLRTVHVPGVSDAHGCHPVRRGGFMLWRQKPFSRQDTVTKFCRNGVLQNGSPSTFSSALDILAFRP
jgi:hypothetical protein